MSKKDFKRGLIVLAVLLQGVFMTSCNNDDDGSSTDGDLLGTWRVVTYTYDGETVTSALGTEITATFDGEAQEIDATLVFTENPNEYVSVGSYDLVVTSVVAGQSNTQTFSIDDFEGEGSWTRSGNTITVEGSIISLPSDIPLPAGTDTTSDITIEELTATTLRLSSVQEEEFSQGGANVSTRVNARMVLTRE